jgi:hypothetical protein
LLIAGLEERDARLVVDRLGVHRVDEADLVRHRAGVRQQLGEPHSVLAVGMPREAEHAGSDRKARLARGHARQPLTIAHGIRQILIKARAQPGLVVVQIEVARRTLHVHVDHALGFGAHTQRERRGRV